MSRTKRFHFLLDDKVSINTIGEHLNSYLCFELSFKNPAGEIIIQPVSQSKRGSLSCVQMDVSSTRNTDHEMKTKINTSKREERKFSATTMHLNEVQLSTLTPGRPFLKIPLPLSHASIPSSVCPSVSQHHPTTFALWFPLWLLLSGFCFI